MKNSKKYDGTLAENILGISQEYVDYLPYCEFHP